VVHKVTHKANGTTLVCKRISLKGMNSKALDEANQEVSLLRRISAGSDYIVKYVESFVERGTLHIIMEFCEHGDLSDYVKAQRGQALGEPTVWKFLLQVALALQWLHSNRILHRDIKALNIFLTAEDDARLGDLGVARVLRDGAHFANTLVGTPYYLSPELCEQRPYNDKSDVWAYGCVLYEMCTQKHPFEAKNQVGLLAKIVRGRYAAVPSTYSPELRALIDECLTHSSDRRPSISEVLSGASASEWAHRLGIGGTPTTEDTPAKAEAQRRWQLASAQVTRLHDDAVKDLDAPTRLIWDSLYRLLRAKMASELTEADHDEIERYIFEELPPENTDLIARIWKILPLQQECDLCQAVLAS